VNFNEKRILVEEATVDKLQSLASTGDASGSRSEKTDVQTRKKGQVFALKYDKLVVTVGCYSQTFGTKGVKENALFLKDVGDARKIRKRILECEFFALN
jgi:NADH dehydrogenase